MYVSKIGRRIGKLIGNGSHSRPTTPDLSSSVYSKPAAISMYAVFIRGRIDIGSPRVLSGRDDKPLPVFPSISTSNSILLKIGSWHRPSVEANTLKTVVSRRGVCPRKILSSDSHANTVPLIAMMGLAISP